MTAPGRFPPQAIAHEYDRGQPFMKSLIVVGIWLALRLFAADELVPARRPTHSVRVFADLKHSGILTGPVGSSALAPGEFGIAAPLQAVSGGRDRWPEKLDTDDQAAERLGRLRVEATQTADEVVVSIDSETHRYLRLYRKDAGAWRRQAASDG